MAVGLLLLRLGVGLILVAHGAQKLFGWFGGPGLTGTGQFLETLGFRNAKSLGLLAGGTEVIGGALVAAGLLTPLGAAAIIGMMVAAIAVVHAPNGFFIQRGGYEYPLALALSAAAVAFTGPGRYSLDYVLGWTLAGSGWGIAALGVGLLSAGAVDSYRRFAAGSSTTRHGRMRPAA